MADATGTPTGKTADAGPSAPPLISGLSRFSGDYDVILCDVWGVIHNGVKAFAPACAALEKARQGGATVVLVSNAPRPHPAVVAMLDSLGAPRTAYDAIVTSGDVTRAVLAAHPGVPAFHLGPERDRSLFEGLELTLAPLAAAGLVVCTGLFDDNVETPEDYADRLGEMKSRGLPFICANPDVVVERGAQLVYCAGAIAEAYAAIGGAVTYCGKPYGPIYDAALKIAAEQRGAPVDKSRVLGIGDALRTDIAGATAAGFDSLFIAGGIHAAELKAVGGATPDSASLAALFCGNARPRGVMPRLAW